jgi:YD repeat-containing protein
VTRPDTGETVDTYDASGQLISSTDPNSVKTTLAYTPLGQVSSETYNDGSTPMVTFSHDANGELTQMVDGTVTSTYGYDAFGDVSSYENGAGQTVSYVDNGLGEPTSITYPLPFGTTWDTTATEVLVYDEAGLLKSFTDLLGKTTQFGYTPDNLMKTVTFPGTIGTETYTYDDADNVDEVNSVTASTLTYAYTFEPSSGIATETDTGTNSGVTPTYNYDSLGRVTALTPSGGSATVSIQVC